MNALATTFKSPIRYYCYLRRMGYATRTAYLSVLSVFCETKEEMYFRANRSNLANR